MDTSFRGKPCRCRWPSRASEVFAGTSVCGSPEAEDNDVGAGGCHDEDLPIQGPQSPPNKSWTSGRLVGLRAHRGRYDGGFPTRLLICERDAKPQALKSLNEKLQAAEPQTLNPKP